MPLILIKRKNKVFHSQAYRFVTSNPIRSDIFDTFTYRENRADYVEETKCSLIAYRAYDI